MVGAIFQTITTVITQFISSLTSAFGGIIALVYTETDGLTVFGTLLLVSAGVAVVYFVFNVIRNLVRRA